MPETNFEVEYIRKSQKQAVADIEELMKTVAKKYGKANFICKYCAKQGSCTSFGVRCNPTWRGVICDD